MDRAVMVVLGRGDVVIEFTRYVGPAPVHQAERGVAIGRGVDHDAHGAHVKHLLESEVLALHPAPDAVDVLRPPVNFGLDSGPMEPGSDLPACRPGVRAAT